MIPTERIEELVRDERIEALKKHPNPFSSLKEAWSELKEEIEEVFAEFQNVITNFRVLWLWVKSDNSGFAKIYIYRVRNAAIKQVKELIQVIGVCDKALEKEIPGFEKGERGLVNFELDCKRCDTSAEICKDCNDKSYFTPKKRTENDAPPEMPAEYYLRWRNRMCNEERGNTCECGFFNGLFCGRTSIEIEEPETAVKIVEDWATKHMGM